MRGGSGNPGTLGPRRSSGASQQLVMSAPGLKSGILPARREASSGSEHLAQVLPALSTLSSTNPPERACRRCQQREASPQVSTRCHSVVSNDRLLAPQLEGGYFQTTFSNSLCLRHKHSKTLHDRYLCFPAKWPSFFSPRQTSSPFCGPFIGSGPTRVVTAQCCAAGGGSALPEPQGNALLPVPEGAGGARLPSVPLRKECVWPHIPGLAACWSRIAHGLPGHTSLCGLSHLHLDCEL